MVRTAWQNLNGLWQYAITAADAQAPSQYAGSILVPYPLESALSGVKRAVQPDERLWYRRIFTIAPVLQGERTLLHFDAVDYEATVYLNGHTVGTHAGGYQRFSLDISGALKPGENELVVKVYDPSDKGPNPYGKQKLNHEFVYYTPSSGIWQTVWLERVPSTYIQSLRLTPDVDNRALLIKASLQGKQDGYILEAIAHSGSKIVARQILQGQTALRIDQPRLWSPDDPFLYDLEVRLLKDGRPVDTVKSYFGLRKIEVRNDAQGITRIYLNNRYTYNQGVADQGFWPDGLYTAPTDAALKFDLQAIKALGFNTVRKHIKIEPERWYMYCDRLGLLVWQDMPSSNNDSKAARAEFEKELEENLSQLHNHPSITTWVLFNEGWGAYDQDRLARWMKRADPSRLLNGHSGPYDQLQLSQMFKRMKPTRLPGPLGGDMSGLVDEVQDTQYAAKWNAADIADMHYYPGPRMLPLQKGVAATTGEHGSFGAFIEGHVWADTRQVGTGLGAAGLTPKQMLEAYAQSVEKLKTLEAQGLSGSNYFEIFDVEQEHQGFITYDREIVKIPVAEMARLNARLVPQAKNYAAATEGFSVKDADQTPEAQRYAGLLSEYQKGIRDPTFLKRLTLMALRQKDQQRATEFGNELIARMAAPYSRESWKVIAAITHTPQDKGFELFRTHTAEANASLGSEAAQKKTVEVIYQDAIEPSFKGEQRAPDWAAMENTVAARYGALGREAVYGTRMMYALVKSDWKDFGSFYLRYFETGMGRSLYPLHSVSYYVLEHVSDPQVLRAAVKVMQRAIDQDREGPALGRYDPVELDTYARLLYKIGRKDEALRWQRKAAELSEGRDAQIIGNLRRMQASST
jgi:tetratricopeptide (TPR) repeat protein